MDRQFWTYLGRRAVQSLIIIAIVIVGSFLLLHLVPGDMVDVLGGQRGDMDTELMAALREKYGIDRPVLVQLLEYVGNVLRGDLGYSYRNSNEVLTLVLQRLPVTILLVVCSVITAVFFGTMAGVFAARHSHKLADVIISMVVLVFYATPIFLTGLGLMIVFSVKLKVLPVGGIMTAGFSGNWFELIVDVATHLILPVVSLSLFYIAIYCRLARASMLQVFEQDYIRTAYAKGLSTYNVIIGHALRNALLPVVTMVGLQIAELFGGALLTETIFSLPGVGRLAYDAVFERDYPLILGVLIVCAFIIILVNLIIDILYTLLDPRVEISR